MARGCVLEIYRATFCGHLVDCWNTETGVTGSSRMFYIFLSRRCSGFSSGSKLRLLSLQWCNPSSNLDTFYGGQQWRPSYLSYCLCSSTQIHRSAMCRREIVWSNITHNITHNCIIGGAPMQQGKWRQSEIPVVMYRNEDGQGIRTLEDIIRVTECAAHIYILTRNSDSVLWDGNSSTNENLGTEEFLTFCVKEKNRFKNNWAEVQGL